MSAEHTTVAGEFIPENDPHAVAHRKTIWNTFYLLLAITAVEFVIAFTKGPLGLGKYLVVTIFVSLTLVKAFYIVAEFMHLKYEAKGLIMSIVVPVLFIIWLIVALLTEGGHILQKWFV
jgi:cytochrome c oxidase subunit 4